MANVNKLTVFPFLETFGCGPGSGSGCACGPQASSNLYKKQKNPNVVLREMMYSLKEYFGDSILIEFVSYSNKESILNSINILNTALTKSGRSFKISTSNYFDYLINAAPIIVVNDNLTYNGRIPETSEVIRYIEDNNVKVKV